MTKDDLRTGMVVELRNGIKLTVLLDTTSDRGKDLLCSQNDFMSLNSYKENLKNDGGYKPDSYDIIKIYDAEHPRAIINHSNLKLIWEREPEKVKVIIDDIELLLPADKAEALKKQLGI